MGLGAQVPTCPLTWSLFSPIHCFEVAPVRRLIWQLRTVSGNTLENTLLANVVSISCGPLL